MAFICPLKRNSAPFVLCPSLLPLGAICALIAAGWELAWWHPRYTPFGYVLRQVYPANKHFPFASSSARNSTQMLYHTPLSASSPQHRSPGHAHPRSQPHHEALARAGSSPRVSPYCCCSSREPFPRSASSAGFNGDK